MTPTLLLACLVVTLRIAIACLFGAAAVGKLRRRDAFEGAVSAYRLLPDALVKPVALALPPLEIAIAIALVAGLTIASIAAAALLALFALGMAVNLLRGRRHIDCGCDPGAKAKPIAWRLVLRNLILGALLLAGLAATSLPLPMRIAAGGAGLLAFVLGHILALLGSFATPFTSGVR